MELRNEDVDTMGQHSNNKIVVVKFFMEEKTDDRAGAMIRGVPFGYGFKGRAQAFRCDGVIKEVKMKNVQPEVEMNKIVKIAEKWGEVLECKRNHCE